MESEMRVEVCIQRKHIIGRKALFDERDDDEIIQSTKEFFRVNYFLFLIDQTISLLQTQFEQFQKYKNTFGFLFNLKWLRNVVNDNLLRFYKNLE